MASGGREWDQGKDEWAQDAWNEYNVQDGGDGKRRKFNDGVRPCSPEVLLVASS
jgi:hypothetical protein